MNFGRKNQLAILHFGKRKFLTFLMLIKQDGDQYDLKIPKDFNLVYVHGKGLSLFANKTFEKGKRIIPMKYDFIKTIDEATPESVQIDDNKFVDTKRLQIEDFINHSCDPSAKIDFDRLVFVAIKDIQKDEEITFNYLTTEYDLVVDKLDFVCKCGSKNCLQHIKGFKFLSSEQKESLRPYLSPFLLKKIS